MATIKQGKYIVHYPLELPTTELSAGLTGSIAIETLDGQYTGIVFFDNFLANPEGIWIHIYDATPPLPMFADITIQVCDSYGQWYWDYGFSGNLLNIAADTVVQDEFSSWFANHTDVLDSTIKAGTYYFKKRLSCPPSFDMDTEAGGMICFPIRGEGQTVYQDGSISFPVASTFSHFVIAGSKYGLYVLIKLTSTNPPDIMDMVKDLYYMLPAYMQTSDMSSAGWLPIFDDNIRRMVVLEDTQVSSVFASWFYGNTVNGKTWKKLRGDEEVFSSNRRAFKKALPIFGTPLTYTLSDDKTYYSCSVGGFEDTIAKVQNSFNNLPVKEIAPYGFAYSNYITEITLPDNITTIGEGAFAACERLATIKNLEKVNHIGSSAFYGCDNLKNLNLSSSLKRIESATFRECGFTNITIPDSVEYIGSSAFHSCKNLQELVLPQNLTELNQASFAHCTSLTKVTMGDNIEAIWRTVFLGCTSLTEIELSKSIKHIHGKVFADCPNLTKVVVPDSIRYTVGNPRESSGNIFDNSPNIQFNIKDDVKYLGNDNNPYALLFQSTGGSTIQPGTKCIGAYAFSDVDMSDVGNLTIPSSVKGISDYALPSGLTTITFSGRVEYMSNTALSGTGAKDIYVPWSSGEVSGAPWGSGATVHYNSN